ncbi:MAG: energy transducer TonB [Candidatus Omnitrophota bacterium]
MNEKLTMYSFVISLTLHTLVLGGAGGFFDFSANGVIPETTLVELKREKPAPLPEIQVLGEVPQWGTIKEVQKSEVRSQKSELIKKKLAVNNSLEAKDEAQEAMLRYQDMIKQKIESCRSYPSWAQRQGIEGTVGIQFLVMANGESKDVQIIQSSEAKMLDAEAIKTIQRSSPFRPIPETIQTDSIAIRVAIVFSLD